MNFYKYEYFLGKDAGHLYIQGILGSLKDTIEIDDLFYYNPNTYTSSTTLSSLNLPTNFQATFKVKRMNNSTTSWLNVGTNSDNCFLFGNTGSQGQIGIFIKENGTYTHYDQSQENVVRINIETEITYSLINGVHTISANGSTVTLTNSNITSRNYVGIQITNNLFKDLKIHEL